MSHSTQSRSQLVINPVALSCYSVAIIAFATAVLGLPISHWPAGPLAIAGGIYMLIGLLSRTASQTAFSQSNEISRQTAGADNLVAEAVGTALESSPPAIRTPDFVTAQR